MGSDTTNRNKAARKRSDMTVGPGDIRDPEHHCPRRTKVLPPHWPECLISCTWQPPHTNHSPSVQSRFTWGPLPAKESGKCSFLLSGLLSIKRLTEGLEWILHEFTIPAIEQMTGVQREKR